MYMYMEIYVNMHLSTSTHTHTLPCTHSYVGKKLIVIIKYNCPERPTPLFGRLRSDCGVHTPSCESKFALPSHRRRSVQQMSTSTSQSPTPATYKSTSASTSSSLLITVIYFAPNSPFIILLFFVVLLYTSTQTCVFVCGTMCYMAWKHKKSLVFCSFVLPIASWRFWLQRCTAPLQFGRAATI